MAGIGFVLKRVVKQGGLGSVVKVALAGAVIVAGPWLLSILGIMVITQLVQTFLQTSSRTFMGVVIYTYAFSLIIFGGFHYIFTRQVADYIYEKDTKKAAGALLFSMLLTGCLAGLISGIAMGYLDLSSIKNPVLFRAGGILLFVCVNSIWLLMIFISLLKRYYLIFIVYLSGMCISALGVLFFGTYYGEAGILFGFALGQFIIVCLLYLLTLLEYPPSMPRISAFLYYAVKFKLLLIAGFFYYWGMWADKVVYWIMLGKPIEQTFFLTFELYDIPVYLANLTIIPGLIFFMIIGETNFYQNLTEFLQRVYRSSLSKIREKKYDMIKSLWTALREQSLFQGVFTILLIVGAPIIGNSLFQGTIDIQVFRITLIAVFFHLLLLTVVLFLFYFQRYGLAALCCFIFLGINTAGSALTALYHLNGLYGLSYCVSAAFAAVLGIILLWKTSKQFDQWIFYSAIKSDGSEKKET